MSSINKSRMQTAPLFLMRLKKVLLVYQHTIEPRQLKLLNPKLKMKLSPVMFSPWLLEMVGFRRAGHTEASVDISKLSKLNPSSVICEVMNEDGRMARWK